MTLRFLVATQVKLAIACCFFLTALVSFTRKRLQLSFFPSPVRASGVTFLKFFFQTIPDKRVGNRSKFSPPPTFNVDNQVIFALFNRAAMGRARSIIYPWFIFFLCRSRALDSRRPALNHAICSVYSKDLQTLLKHKYTDNVTDSGFILWNIYFLLVLALDSKGKINTLKRYYVSHGMRWLCNFHFRYVTDKIFLTLQVYFAKSVSLKFLQFLFYFFAAPVFSLFALLVDTKPREQKRRIKKIYNFVSFLLTEAKKNI